MQTKSTEISFKDQDIYIGIDVHLKSWKVTIMLDYLIFKTFSMNPSVEELVTYLHKNFPEGKYFSAYEAGFCGFSIHRALTEKGVNNLVVNPADIPTTDKERKQKEDKRDSRKIARSLQNGELIGIYIPQKSTVEFRDLVRGRKTIVKDISRNKTRIKSKLHFYGIAIPKELDTESRYWSGRFTSWIRDIKMTTSYGEMVINDLLDITIFLRKKLLRINRELRAIQYQGEYSKCLGWLCSISGIGLITAVTFLSELEDITRFKNLDRLCSFVGLIPTTSSSGEKDKTGRMTPRSNKPLRAVIVEAAWMAIRNDPSLALSFNNLCKRMKKNDAIIRIAKKLLNRMRFVLINETEYINAVV
jgi:transposase